MKCVLSAALAFPLFALAHPHPRGEVVHARSNDGGAWHHEDNHPVYALFGRATTFPEVGTAAWKAGFPPPLYFGQDPKVYAPIANIKPEWKAALDAAVKAGKIPDIPVSTDPSYNGDDKSVCASGDFDCKIDGDIWDAPEGVFASSFDDGPLPSTSALLKFLKQNQVTTTHSMIGTAMLLNANVLKEVIASGDDLAVHTWSHRLQSTLTNEEVAGELGWTMQLIYNSTGGKLPKYWRPPQGDSDRRVSAIAREVFGLTTVIWNKDSNDWQIGSNAKYTQSSVSNALKGFIDTPSKNPGLVILEHELTDTTVNIFTSQFPEIAAQGWKFMSLASAFGGSPYQDNVQLFGDVNNSTSIPNTTSTMAPSVSLSSSPSSSSSTTPGLPSSDSTRTAQDTNSAMPHFSASSSTSCVLLLMHSMAWLFMSMLS